MNNSNGHDDTIAAIATPLGQGAIGIVRLSGKDALSIADCMFVTKQGKRPSEFKNFTVHYGWIVKSVSRDQDKRELKKNEMIDEVLLMVMRAPKSYTKEDMIEISCHGGLVSLRTILSLILDLGARLADPGEFTKRAFLNGRIDLTQAEAVLDIIQSKTEAFLRVSTNQLKGELSIELEAIREQLMQVYVQMEVIVNFPEDDINAAGREKLSWHIALAHQSVEKLLASSHRGRILKEGIRVVLCGKPNVGKSSLLNVLLKMPRAIVSEIAGTTRDTIEETAQIKGIPFQLVDTAGILEPRDFIEQEAIKRSRLYMKSADLVILILDSSGPLTREDQELMAGLKDQNQNVLVVLNKSDLPSHVNETQIKTAFPMSKGIIKISALQKIGIEELERTIVECVWQGDSMAAQGIMISNLRHMEALKKCQEALEEAKVNVLRLSVEFVSEEIKIAIRFLDQITGRSMDSDLLDKIFSQFCIGK